MAPGTGGRVFGVGGAGEGKVESEMLGQVGPHRENVTCASLTDGVAIQRAYPGVSHVRITPHEPLPFADNAFDIVYSNAVLEHAGSREQQRFFLKELCRVAKRRFVAVPNPLF